MSTYMYGQQIFILLYMFQGSLFYLHSLCKITKKYI